MRDTLGSGFLASAAKYPDNEALRVDGQSFTYAQLHARATAWAALLAANSADAPKMTAVYGRRTAVAHTGILAALLRGHGYVPLSPAFPAERTARMLDASGAEAVILDPEALTLIEGVLPLVDRTLVLLVPEGDFAEQAARHPEHTWLGPDAIAGAPAWTEPDVDLDAIAYLLFTSGSTGMPKGVMVAHRNVRHFIDVMVERYTLGPEDRFSQTFELVFDLSVFDHFCAWQVGGCVSIPSLKDLMAPARWLATEQITIWFSVPSVGVLMKRLRMLRAGFYPSVRFALFCGEALPQEVAHAFAEACPNAVVENLYGPTEVTLATTLYRYDPETSPAECHNGLVPIGDAYPGMVARVVDAELREVSDGTPGELLMSGPQVCPGYWKSPERTAQRFVPTPEHPAIHYRTGDRVVRLTPGGPLQFVGRVDHQVQVRGHRVELGEVEAAVRDRAGVDAAVAIAWPLNPAGADGIVVFLDTDAPADLLDQLETRLPAYMVPSEIKRVDAFPLNANGKIDRNVLKATLE